MKLILEPVGVGFHPDPKKCVFDGRGWNLAPTDFAINLSLQITI